jgi:DNA-binding XRE family transcriptional regulator
MKTKLQQRREVAGLTIEELAGKITENKFGIVNTIGASVWEEEITQHEKHLIDIDNWDSFWLKFIAEALNCKVEDLLEND